MKMAKELWPWLLLWLVATGVQAQEAAQVVALSGQADSRRGDQPQWSRVAVKQQLEAGSHVRTRARSTLALLLADRTQVRMNAEAELRLLPPQADKTLLELVLGRLWSRTKQVPAGLELKTPSAVAVVRGTDWDIEVEADGSTRLSVLSGVVELSNAYGAVSIGPAEEGLARVGQAPVKRQLVNPRDRVQWVMSSPVNPGRYREFALAGASSKLQQVRDQIAQGEMEVAYQALRRLASENKTAELKAPVQLLLADFEFAAQQYDQAMERLDRLAQHEKEPRAWARKSQMQVILGQMKAARDTLDKALAEYPGQGALLAADGDWHRLQGHPERAVAAYRAILTEADEFYQRLGYFGLGRVALERGHPAQAVHYLQAAVRLEPDNALFLGELATALTRAYRGKEAEANYRKALDKAPDDFVSLAGRGLLSLQRGQPDEAREALLKALVIEPRFARGQVGLAVAEYQLGHGSAAMDSLERAMQADPQDPLPWQLRSIILLDSGDPVAAIEASREALKRLPYLKSLDQLAVDSQGSANLGTALSALSMEHWSRAYAEASSYPLWAGSHLFMSERLDSQFGRSSALFKGYLTDPTFFGTGARRANLFERPGQEVDLQATWYRTEPRDVSSVSGTWRGLATESLHGAGLVRLQGMKFDPRNDPESLSYRLEDLQGTLALGVRPTEKLGLFGLYNVSDNKLRFTPPVVLGNGFLFDQPQREHTDRADLGGSYRWGREAQSWMLINDGRRRLDTELFSDQFGPQNYRYRLDESGLSLRHTEVLGDHRLSFGWEGITQTVKTSLGDAFFSSQQNTRVRSEQYWLSSRWQRESWVFHTALFRPVLKFDFDDRAVDPQTGDLFFAPFKMDARRDGALLPRLGVSFQPGAGSGVHLAYIEHVQGVGNQTLAPVSVGRIPLDYQYLLPGTLVQKIATLVDLEINPRTFLSFGVQRQELDNVTDDTGLLFASRFTPIFNVIEQIEPRSSSGGMVLNPYDVDPLFEKGRLDRFSLGANRIVSASVGVAFDYRYADTENTGVAFPGNRLPGFPEHDLALVTTFHHEARNFTAVGARYHNGFFSDEANTGWNEPGWSLTVGHSRESSNRDWGLDVVLSGELDGYSDPSLFVRGLRRW